MKQLNILFIVVLSLQFAGLAMSDNSDTIIINYEVAEIGEINVNGSISLTIDSATAGQAPDDAVDSATYDITTNGTNKKITGRLGTANMPDGVTLSLNMSAPFGSGSSKGYVELTSTDADLVTGVTKVAESGLDMMFRLSASVAAGIVAPANEMVILTITDGS